MNNPLSKSAQSVQNILNQKGIETTVLELPSSTRTAQDAANTLGCKIEQIVKSLVFKTFNNSPILILASGSNRVNEKMIAEVVGEKIVKATADFTREVTGFAIGGIPPIGHKKQIRTLIDQNLLKYEKIWAAAGTPHSVFCMNSKDLIHITNGQIIKIC